MNARRAGLCRPKAASSALEVDQSGRRETLPADADRARLRRLPGQRRDDARAFRPGRRHDATDLARHALQRGDGIRMALRARRAISPATGTACIPSRSIARANNSAPVVLRLSLRHRRRPDGHRFFDEGAGLVHETWEAFARDIHFAVPGRIAYAILDSRLFEIADYQRAIRSDVPPFRADTLAELAELIGVDAAISARTVAAYNAACTGDAAHFDATRCDGLAARTTSAAAEIELGARHREPPFLACPLVGAIAYTFGGLATDARARVLADGAPIPGLYAAGEITGHFYGTAPNAVSVLRALVFGRIAGRRRSLFELDAAEISDDRCDAFAGVAVADRLRQLTAPDRHLEGPMRTDGLAPVDHRFENFRREKRRRCSSPACADRAAVSASPLPPGRRPRRSRHDTRRSAPCIRPRRRRPRWPRTKRWRRRAAQPPTRGSPY